MGLKTDEKRRSAIRGGEWVHSQNDKQLAEAMTKFVGFTIRYAPVRRVLDEPG